MPTNTTVYISSELSNGCSGEIAADNAIEVRSRRIVSDGVILLREVGRERLLARLNFLVNADVLGLEGARKIWRGAFGGDLLAIKDR